jgi:hypothetical protein
MKPSAPSNGVFVLVEDPGAANYVAPLPKALANLGIRSSIFALGPAAKQLRSLNTDFETIANDVSLAAVVAARKPSLLLVGASEDTDGLGLDLIDLGKRLGVTTIGVVDGPANPDHRFSGGTANPRQHAPDYVALADEQTRQVFLAQGYATDRAVNCGHPHYDFVRAEKRRMDALDRDILRAGLGFNPAPGQNVVIFCAELSTGLNGPQYRRAANYTLQGLPSHGLRTEIVLDEFFMAVEQMAERPYLVLRLHPKNQLAEFTEYLSRFDLVSAAGNSLEAIYCADLVVGMTSIILVEAALLELSTLSIIPRRSETAWLPTIGLGITSHCVQRTDIKQELDAGLANRTADTSVLNNALPVAGTDNVIKLICAAMKETEAAC